MAETLQIIINAKDNASPKIHGVGKSFRGLRSAAATAAKVGVAGFAALGVGAVALGIKAIGAGSDVEEMMGKFNVVFGKSAPQATAALDAFGAAVGRNKFDLRGMAASVQDTFVPLGFARETAAGMSVQLVKLATDVASFNNANDVDVMRDFQSALVGNTETVRKYGIVVTQATLDAELLRMGVEGGVKAASEQEKVQARLNLIMAGTSDAQGDAARTAGSWANTMRSLKSSLAETTAEIGSQLLPVLTPLLQSFATFARDHGPQVAAALGAIVQQVAAFVSTLQKVSNFGDLAQALGVSGEVVAKITGAFDKIRSAFEFVTGFIRQNAEGFKAAGAALLAFAAPTVAGVVIGAIAAVGSVLVGLLAPIAPIIAAAALIGTAWQNNWLGIRDVVADAVSVIGEKIAAIQAWIGEGGLQAVVTTLQAKWQEVWAALSPYVEQAATVIGEKITAIQTWIGEGGLQAVVASLQTKWSEVWNAIGPYVEQAATVIGDSVESIKGWIGEGGIQATIETLQIKWGEVWTAIGPYVTQAVYIIGQGAESIKMWIGDGGIQDTIATLQGKWAEVWGVIGPYVTQAATLIGEGITSIKNWIGEGGIQATLVTLQAAWAGVWETIGPFVTQAATVIGEGVASIKSWIGEGGIQSSLASLQTKWSEVSSAMQTAWGMLVEFFTPTIERLKEAVGPMIESFAPLGEKFGTLGDAAGGLAEALKPVVEVIGVVLVGAFNLLLEIVAAVMPDVGTLVGDAVDIITSVINTATGVIQGIVDLVKALFEGDWSAAWEAAGSIVDSLVTGIIEIVGTLYDEFSIIFGDIIAGISEWIGNINSDAQAKFDEFILSAKTTLAELPGKFIDAIADVRSAIAGFSLHDVGRALMQGMVDGIKSMAGALADAAKNTVNNAVNAAKGLLGIHSPSTIFIEIGQNVIAGLVQGIESMSNEAAKRAADVIKSITGSVLDALRAITDLGKADLNQDFNKLIQPLLGFMDRAAWAMRNLMATTGLGGKNASKLMKNFNSVMGGIMKMLIDAAKLAGLVNDLGGKPDGLSAAITWLSDMVEQAGLAMQQLQSGALGNLSEGFIEFSKQLSAAVGPLEAAVGLADKLVGFEWPAVRGQGVVRWLASMAGMAGQAVLEIQKWQGLDFGEDFKDFANGLKTAMGPLKAAVDFANKLGEFQWPEQRGQGMIDWLASLTGQVAQAVTWLRRWGGMDFGEEFSAFADNLRASFGPLNEAIGFVANLKAFEWAKDLPDKIKHLRWALANVIVHMHKLYVLYDDFMSTEMVNFVRDVGSLADGLDKAVRLLGDLAGVNTDDVSAVVGVLTSMLGDILTGLQDTIDDFDVQQGPIISAFGQAISGLMQGLQSALQLAAALPATWTNPSDAVWLPFRDWVFRVMAQLDHLVGVWFPTDGDKAKDWTPVVSFGQAISGALGGFQTALQLAAALPETWTNPSDAVWLPFRNWVFRTMAQLGRLVGVWFPADPDDPDKAKDWTPVVDFGQAISGALGGFQTALQLAAALPSTWTNPSDAVWLPFRDWVFGTMAQLDRLVRTWFPTEGDAAKDWTPVTAFGQAISGALGGFQTALTLAAALPSTWTSPSDAVWLPFRDWVLSVMSQLSDQIPLWFTDELEGDDPFGLVAAFGQAASAVFSGLASALTVFDGLATLIMPTDTQLQDFMDAVKTTMDKAKTSAEGLGDDAIAAITPFGTAMQSLFDGLQSGLSVFSALYDAGAGFAGWLAGAATNGSPFQTAMADLFNAITETLQRFKANVIEAAGSEWLPAADAFLSAVSDVFAVLKSALDVFGQLDKQGLPDTDMIKAFVEAVLKVFGDFTTGLSDTASNMADAGAEIGSGLAGGLNAKISGITGSETVEGQVRYMTRTVSDILNSNIPHYNDAKDYGVNVGRGLADGLTGQIDSVSTAARGLGEIIAATIEDTLGIASPSKKGFWAGKMTAEGIKNGLLRGVSGVAEAAGSLADAATPWGSTLSIKSTNPVMTIRVEGDISIGGQQLAPETSNAIADIILERMRLAG